MNYLQIKAISLFVCLFLLTNCSKTEDITYDVYFWALESNSTQEFSAVFIDGKEEGSLVNLTDEIDCNASDTALDDLLTLQLSTGTYEIEVRNELGESKRIGQLEIKTNLFSNSIGISNQGDGGEVKVHGGDECLTVRIAL